MKTEQELESLSLEEIRKLAEAEEVPGPAQVELGPDGKPFQPRDEAGRFVKTEPEQTAIESEVVEPEVIKVVDLGDGSGRQVFKGRTGDEVLEKVLEAQANATRKIRQQEIELKDLRAKTAPKAELPKLTADEEFVLSQQLNKEPSKALDEYFRRRTGFEMAELAEMKRQADKMTTAESTNHALAVFLATHPDFVDGTWNSAAMKLAIRGKAITTENLHEAYLDLKDSGLLELRTEGENSVQESQPEQVRIEPKTPAKAPTQGTKKSSGLSTQSRPAPVASTNFSEDEAYALPLAELRKRAEAQLKAK
jgi:23S rRNA pseudoU1915 N3-methylase RlmH